MATHTSTLNSHSLHERSLTSYMFWWGRSGSRVQIRWCFLKNNLYRLSNRGRYWGEGMNKSLEATSRKKFEN